jgi:cytochrome c
MEFLEKFVIPQSSEHLQLLHYLAMLIFFLFIPFISMVFGGTFLSLFYRHKGHKENNKNFLLFSNDIIEVVTISKSIGIVLGIVPLLTAVLIFSQLLHLGNTTAVVYLSVSFLLVIAALTLIYTYRYSTKFSSIFNSLNEIKVKDSSVMNEIAKLKESSTSVSHRSGIYGLILLFLSIWIFTSGVTIATFPKEWSEGSFFLAGIGKIGFLFNNGICFYRRYCFIPLFLLGGRKEESK